MRHGTVLNTGDTVGDGRARKKMQHGVLEGQVLRQEHAWLKTGAEW